MRITPHVPDLAALDLFLSVVDLGSLGRAAEAHGISQSSVSSRIRYMEKLIGTPVLERSTLGSRPTQAGNLVAEWARTVVAAAQQLDAGIADIRGRRRTQLKVAASLTVAEYLFPRWLIALRAQAPQATVALEAANSQEVGDAVLSGHIPLGFIECPRAPKGLDSEVVARDRLLVVVAPQHAWARRTAITTDELANTPLIQREAGSGTRLAFERALTARLPGWRPTAGIALSSTTAIKNAVTHGAGPAVLSSLAVDAELAVGSLRTVTVTGFDAGRTLRAVWPMAQRPVGLARDLYAIASQTGREGA